MTLFRSAILLVAALLFTPLSASAETVVKPSGAPMTLELNQGALVRMDQPASSVFIANPDIADVAVKSPRLVYVFGKRPGTTTLYAVDDNERVLVSRQVSVTHDLSSLRTALRDLLPSTEIDATSVEGGVIISGQVGNATQAENARRVAARFIGQGEEVINQLRVTEANQVSLRVRIAEVSRTLIRQLGISWNTTSESGDIAFGLATQNFGGALASFGSINQSANLGRLTLDSGSFDLNALIDALAQQGLVSVLAEPTLTALSGETASFLAGGEFPVPVAQEGNGDTASITIEFKTFGVSLAFTPTIVGDGRISMKVRPEVSQLTNFGAVTLGEFTIPALTTRRAQTTVELGSGQSFAIAGLLQNSATLDAQKVPGLGDIPVLGQLFRSDNFRRDETELVIIVTPYLVNPISAGAKVALPTDAATGPAGSQRLVMGHNPLSNNIRQNATGSALAGPNGFVIE